MKVEGTVDSVYSKTKSTRSGDKVIYYAEVDGTEINMGFKPVWEEGEYISTNVEEKYGELQISRKPTTGGSGSTGKAFPKSTGSGPSKGGWKSSGGKFPVEPTDSQVSIIRQSSLNRAVETVGNMVRDGVFKPSSEKAYMEKLMELAYAYTDFGTGQREVKMAKEREVKRAALEAVNG